MSIKKHPILGDAPEVEEVTVILDGVPIKVEKGQMIAAALLEKGVRVNRYTRKNYGGERNFLRNWSVYRLCYDCEWSAECTDLHYSGRRRHDYRDSEPDGGVVGWKKERF